MLDHPHLWVAWVGGRTAPDDAETQLSTHFALRVGFPLVLVQTEVVQSDESLCGYPRRLVHEFAESRARVKATWTLAL